MSTTPSILIRIATGLLLAAALWLLPVLAYTQTDTISGVINRYAKVPFMCNGAFVVDNPCGFKRGDKVLIVQMLCADSKAAYASALGDLLSYRRRHRSIAGKARQSDRVRVDAESSSVADT